jgi:hypothetical protein
MGYAGWIVGYSSLTGFRIKEGLPVIRPGSVPRAEITAYKPRLNRTMPNWITPDTSGIARSPSTHG